MWKSFINVVYDFEKHSGWVALLERPSFILEKFVSLLRERDENLKWEKCKDKDFNLTYGR